MTRVSKKQLEKNTQRHISNHLVLTLKSPGSHGVPMFYKEFFSESEFIMLAKRLAVIYMLLEGASFRQIAEVLRVSTSTIERIDNDLQSGELKTVRGVLDNRKKREAFWKEMEVCIRAGMPSMGKDRWAWLDDVMQS